MGDIEPENSQWELVKEIGQSGAFNKGVYIVRRKTDGFLAIKKIMNPNEDDLGPKIDDEIRIMQRLWTERNYYVCQYVDKREVANTGTAQGQRPWIALYMRYSTLGELTDVIDKHKVAERRICEEFIWHALVSIGKALALLHFGINEVHAEENRLAGRSYNAPATWESIVHCDLKPSNIFLTKHSRHRYPSVMLGDYGGATNPGGLEFAVTPQYLSPDFCAERPNSQGQWNYWTKTASAKMDIYALGMTIADMMMLRCEERPPGSEVRVVSDSAFAECGYSTNLIAVVKAATNTNVERRPDSRQLVQMVNREMQSTIARGRIRPIEQGPTLPAETLPEEVLHQPGEFEEKPNGIPSGLVRPLQSQSNARTTRRRRTVHSRDNDRRSGRAQRGPSDDAIPSSSSGGRESGPVWLTTRPRADAQIHKPRDFYGRYRPVETG